MSSTISANISAAASKAVQNPQSQVAHQTAQVPNTNAVAQASQANARAQSVKPKDDKKRDIQTSKRTEGSFAPKTVKPKSSPLDSEHSDGAENPEKVDVLA